jgi:Mrp family chromosome partitioning ATPase/capsular polysaccharide biosynthesis protein
MTEELLRSRYLTLRDYLAVLRRYWLGIVLVAVVGGAAGLADAKRQTPIYQASATVAFQDPAQSLSIVGLGTGPVQEPGVVAEQQSETLTRPAIMVAAQRLLHTRIPAAELAGGVSSQISSAGFLEVIGSSANPTFAAQLANAVAQVVVTQHNQQARAGYAAAASAIQSQITQLRANPRTPSGLAQLTVLGNELAPLLALRKVAQGASVEQLAQVPGAPSSPNTTRSTLIGLGIGLLAGILFAFLRDALDRRIRTTRDIEDSYGLPLLGHVRDRVMGKVAPIANGVKGDYALDLEAFRIIRRNLEFLSRDSAAKTVLVTSAVPSEGKTTVAASLACAMAAGNRRTLLVECDLRRPVLADRLNFEAKPGLSEYLVGTARPDEILRVVEIADGPPANGNANAAAQAVAGLGRYSLVCIPAGTATSRAAELLGSSRFEEFIRQVSGAYDVVVIDTSPLLPLADTLEILPHADAILLCARARKTTREEALAVKTALERFSPKPTGIVVTDIKPGRSEYQAYSYSYSYS